MLLEPVSLPSGVRNVYDVTAFSICPQKVIGIQYFFEGGIEVLLNAQKTFATNSPEYRALQSERNRLMEHSALLTVMNNLTDHGVEINDGTRLLEGTFGLQQRVVLGVNNVPPIRVSAGIPNGTTVTVSHGTISGYYNDLSLITALQPVHSQSRRGLHGLTFTPREISASDINISSIYSGPGVNRANLRATSVYFDLKHQFDIGSHISEGAMGLLVGIATSNLYAGASFAIDLASIFADIPLARAEMQNIQSDFTYFGHRVDVGNFHEHFSLTGVVITENGQPPKIVSWPTADTWDALMALNSTLQAHDNLSDIIEHPESVRWTHYTWEQFRQNPHIIFEVYTLLNPDGMDDFVPRITTHRNRRNTRLNTE